MKRNRFGINLDEGVPLTTEAEFELLYVPCFGAAEEQLNSWLVEGNKPLLLGGQIGSGKSTIISKSIQVTGKNPDVTLHFDQETLNLDAGDFWSILLIGILELALMKSINLGFCKLPEELGDYQGDNWQALLDGLRPRTFSMDSFNLKLSLRKKVAKNTEYIAKIVVEIGRLLQDSIERPIFIFAAGLDKFDPQRPTFFAMQDVVAILSDFKTLYEVNAAHLFQKPGSPFYSLDRLYIPVLNQGAVVEMLSKRMGIYAQSAHRELETLAAWSGGNPRQAIRLLTHFETARKNRGRKIAECLAMAIRETTGDFFAYSPKPSPELIKTIRRTATINAAMFSLPGDKETALRALYGNWIFISEKSVEATWSVSVNPLVKMAFEGKTTTEDPEMQLLRDYATISGISATGLSLNRVDEKSGQEKSPDQLLWEFIASGVEHPIHTSLSETLDVLSDALLSPDRADRVIIAIKNSSVAEAARAYLFAKANSYEYQRCKHTVIAGGPGMNPLEKIEAFLSEDIDIFSIQFSEKWENGQLEALDKKRDFFINYQMLWWIPFNDLKNYLASWTQLRQLFEILILEDELLGSISEEEVRADLAYFEDLTGKEQGSVSNVVANLKIILDYMNKTRIGAGS